MRRRRSKNFKKLSGGELLEWLDSPERQEPSPPPEIKPPRIKKSAKLPELAAGTNSGSDKNTFANLKKGKLPVEARLDLHGLSLGAAREAVENFIDNCWNSGKRCVLIITGKGRSSAPGNPTINSEFTTWLNSPETRGKIISFTAATAKDGGSGAFYVLLKRRR